MGRLEPRGCGWVREVIAEAASAEKVGQVWHLFSMPFLTEEMESERGSWGLPGHIYCSWRNSLLYLRRKYMTGRRNLGTPTKLKESMFCCLASDSLQKTTHKPLEPPTWTWPYQIMGTSKAPNAKYTLTPSHLLPPFLCSTSFSCFRHLFQT